MGATYPPPPAPNGYQDWKQYANALQGYLTQLARLREDQLYDKSGNVVKDGKNTWAIRGSHLSSTFSTDSVVEGSTNKYYTTARAQSDCPAETVITIGSLIGSSTHLLTVTAATKLALQGPVTGNLQYSQASELAAYMQTALNFVPTTRTVNGYFLSANVSLAYTDVGAEAGASWIFQASDYNPSFSSTGVTCACFNASSSGALSLPAGTYEFEWVQHFTCSTVSGNRAFGVVCSGGSATAYWQLQGGGGAANTNINAATVQWGSGISTNAILASSTAAGGYIRMRGWVVVTSTTSFIPSFSQNVNCSVVFKAGSFCRVWQRTASTSPSYSGAWT